MNITHKDGDWVTFVFRDTIVQGWVLSGEYDEYDGDTTYNIFTMFKIVTNEKGDIVRKVPIGGNLWVYEDEHSVIAMENTLEEEDINDLINESLRTKDKEWWNNIHMMKEIIKEDGAYLV